MIHKKQFDTILGLSVLGGVVATIATAGTVPAITAFVATTGFLGIALTLATAISNALPQVPARRWDWIGVGPSTTHHHHHHTHQNQNTHSVHYKTTTPSTHHHTKVVHTSTPSLHVKKPAPVTFSDPKPTVGKTHSFLGEDKIVKTKPSQPATKSHIGSDVILRGQTTQPTQAKSVKPVLAKSGLSGQVIMTKQSAAQTIPNQEPKKSGFSDKKIIRKR